MGWFGPSDRGAALLPEHKFDYINLNDFHSHGALAPFAYFTIFIGMLISFGAFAADVYTAINLLIFNRWSSKLNPVIQFSISKWIFAGCIILSFVALAIEWIIAAKAIRGNGVADIYLNRIAQRWCSLFGGRGRKEDTGWKRFLVFARLTKSKKGVDYVALFTYFSFQGWIRIVFAEGPRQVINALTLVAVFEANLIPKGVHKGEELSAIVTFFKNYKILADQDTSQAVILGSMAFTLIVWTFAMLQLFIAAVLYLFFLCHVMSGHLGLGAYCKERVDERLANIVATNHHKALARAETNLGTNGDPSKPLDRRPTIPLGFAVPGEKGLMAPTRANTVASQASSLGPNRVPTLPNIQSLEKGMSDRRPGNIQDPTRPYGPARAMTDSSLTSTTDLLSAQAEMGYGGRGLDRAPTASIATLPTYRENEYVEMPYAQSNGRPSPVPNRNPMRPQPPPQSRQQYADCLPPRNTPGPYQRPMMTTSPSNYSNYSGYAHNYNYDQYETPEPPPPAYRHQNTNSNAATPGTVIDMFPEHPSGYPSEYPNRVGTAPPLRPDTGHQSEYPNRAGTAPPLRHNIRSPPNVPPSGFARPPLNRAFTSSPALQPQYQSQDTIEQRSPFIELDGERGGLGGRSAADSSEAGESYEMTTQTPQRTQSAFQKPGLNRAQTERVWMPQTREPPTVNPVQQRISSRTSENSQASSSPSPTSPSRSQAKTPVGGDNKLSRTSSNASSTSSASLKSDKAAGPASGVGQAKGQQQYIAYNPNLNVAESTSQEVDGTPSSSLARRERRITPPQRSQTAVPYEHFGMEPGLVRSATAPPPPAPPPPAQPSRNNRESYDPFGEQYSQSWGIGR